MKTITQRIKHYIAASESTSIVVYHRTREHDTVEKMRKEGMAKGEHGVYGPGIYTTYNISSQLKRGMKKYGTFLIKAKVNKHNFIDLDANRDRIRDYLEQQFKPHNKLYRNWLDVADKIMSHGDPYYTSGVAERIWGLLDPDKYFNGMIYTGRQDGKCCVVYNPRAILPFAYADMSPHHEADITGGDWDDADQSMGIDGRDIEWHSILNRETITRNNAPTSKEDIGKNIKFKHLFAFKKGQPVEIKLDIKNINIVDLPGLKYKKSVSVTKAKDGTIDSGADFEDSLVLYNSRLSSGSSDIIANFIYLYNNSALTVRNITYDAGIVLEGRCSKDGDTLTALGNITAGGTFKCFDLLLNAGQLKSGRTVTFAQSTFYGQSIVCEQLRITEGSYVKTGFVRANVIHLGRHTTNEFKTAALSLSYPITVDELHLNTLDNPFELIETYYGITVDRLTTANKKLTHKEVPGNYTYRLLNGVPRP